MVLPLIRRFAFAPSVLAFLVLALVMSMARRAHGQAPIDYTLVVESDDPAVAYDALAPRLERDLGGPVAPPPGPARRGAIVIRYRAAGRDLTVHVSRTGTEATERSIIVQGDVVDEAVLLAGNLARDEAAELLSELAERRRQRLEATPPPAPRVEEKPVIVPEPRWSATFAFAHPLATNHAEPDVRSPFNVALLYGRVGRTTGLQAALVGVAYASRSVKGAQLALGAAATGGPAEGLQLSAGAAFATGKAEGAQLATVFDYAGEVRGLQLAAGATLAGTSVHGVQLASVLNLATRDLRGLQGSGFVNLTGSEVSGAQLGLVNIADSVSGTQIGLVNIGRRVRGFQLGLVNIAEDVDEAIGLATIARDSVHVVSWGSNLAYTNAGLRFSSKHFYSKAAIGFGTLETGFNGSLVATLAAGSSFVVRGGFGLDVEFAYTHAETVNEALHPRLIAGYAVAKRLRVIVGSGPRIPFERERGSLAVRPEVLAGLEF